MSDPISFHKNQKVSEISQGESHLTEKGGKITAATKISSLEDLKKLPGGEELHREMLLSLATNMITDMRHKQEHLQKMWREARNNG